RLDRRSFCIDWVVSACVYYILPTNNVEFIRQMPPIWRKVIWNHIGAGQAHCEQSVQLRCSYVVMELRIAVMFHPVKAIVLRMVNTIRAAEREIDRWYSQVIDKDCVIRAGTKRNQIRIVRLLGLI